MLDAESATSYELAVGLPPATRVPAAFAELAQAICPQHRHENQHVYQPAMQQPPWDSGVSTGRLWGA
jgi:hypothetical protein